MTFSRLLISVLMLGNDAMSVISQTLHNCFYDKILCGLVVAGTQLTKRYYGRISAEHAGEG